MDWINLAQDKDKWQGLVNLQVPQSLGNFLTSGGSNSSSGRTLLQATLISWHTQTAAAQNTTSVGNWQHCFSITVKIYILATCQTTQPPNFLTYK